MALTIIAGMSVACGDSGLATMQPSAINATSAGRVAVQKGRNKAGPGNTCVFDPNDSGPDQCTPAGEAPPPSGNLQLGGRFKAGPGGVCVFDPNDSGPNQCTPPGGLPVPPSTSGGRFKAGPGNTCVFDPNDSGPNQCTPASPSGPPANVQLGGRFKAGPGGTCVFDPNDSGPNQCTP